MDADEDRLPAAEPAHEPEEPSPGTQVRTLAQIDAQLERLVRRVQDYSPDADVDLIRRAYGNQVLIREFNLCPSTTVLL